MLPNKILIYPSAVATFYVPSDLSWISGMNSEHIHAVDTWCQGVSWYGCMFINTGLLQPGMHGLDVARARLFFSFTFEQVKYSCAFIHWFSKIGEFLDEGTRMWSVKPEVFNDGSHNLSIIHLDSIVCLAHLLPIHHNKPVSSRHQLNYTWSLDAFSAFYVNKYADHHAFEIYYLEYTILYFYILRLHQQNSDFDWGAWRSLKLFQVALKHFFLWLKILHWNLIKSGLGECLVKRLSSLLSSTHQEAVKTC